MKKLLVALILLAAPAWAQNGGYSSGGSTASGGFIYTGVLSGIPATCVVGQTAFITDATAGQNQYNCSATNTWTQNLNSGAGGASIALDNLTAPNINTPLLAQTGVDLGSTSKPFKNLYLWGSGTYGTTSLQLTGTPTGARVLTIPDATGTFAVSATSPITLSGAGALACATCVVSSSPGAGIAHFAGSTQTVTSSAINLANADVTGNLGHAHLNSGTGASASTFWAGNDTWTAAVTSVATTSPLGGGTITGTGTLTCTTCTTNASALTLNLPVIGAGGQATAVGTVTGNTTQFPTFAGAATAARCIDTDASGNLQVTAADCGTGSSGISGLTTNYIPLASSATTIGANSHMDDGVTTASTVTSSENIAAPSFIVTGTCNTGTAACISLKNGTAPSSFDANSFMLFAPGSITTGYGWKAPAAAATGIVRGDNSSNTVTISQSELSGDATTSGSNAVTVVATHLSSALPVAQGGTGDATLTAHGVLIGAGTSAVAPTSAGTSGQCLTSNGASSDPTFQTCGVGAGVSSFSGDGTLISNSLSTGAVTATLANAGAHKYWGNNTGSTAAPGYFALVAADIPSAIPIGNIGSAGLSGTSPVAIASTGAISCTNCAVINSTNTGTSSMTMDLSAASVTAGLKVPVAAGAAPTADGFVALNSTTHALVHGSNGTTIVGAAAATGTNTSTTCTNQVVTVISSVAVPTCTTITSAYVDSTIAPTTSAALVTPNIGAATGTSLLATGLVDGTAPVIVTTGTTGTPGGTYNHSYSFNQEATAGTGVTYTLPTAAAGKQYCIANDNNGSAANTGILTVATSASGQFIVFTDGTLSATGGNVTSAGAAADAVCMIGIDSTHWHMFVQSGTWSKH